MQARPAAQPPSGAFIYTLWHKMGVVAIAKIRKKFAEVAIGREIGRVGYDVGVLDEEFELILKIIL